MFGPLRHHQPTQRRRQHGGTGKRGNQYRRASLGCCPTPGGCRAWSPWHWGWIESQGHEEDGPGKLEVLKGPQMWWFAWFPQDRWYKIPSNQNPRFEKKDFSSHVHPLQHVNAPNVLIQPGSSRRLFFANIHPQPLNCKKSHPFDAALGFLQLFSARQLLFLKLSWTRIYIGDASKWCTQSVLQTS